MIVPVPVDFVSNVLADDIIDIVSFTKIIINSKIRANESSLHVEDARRREPLYLRTDDAELRDHNRWHHHHKINEAREKPTFLLDRFLLHHHDPPLGRIMPRSLLDFEQ